MPLSQNVYQSRAAGSLLRLIWLIGLAASLAAAPGQAPGQEEGSPILVVESYATSPTLVSSGQRFTLTATVKNIGTKHAEQIVASVAANSQFVQLGPAAQVGQIDPGMSATFSVQVQAGTLSTGAYDLGLNFAYRIGTSGEFNTPRSVGISVQGAPASVTGDPQVVIERAAPLSLPAMVGEGFNVQVVLRNAGPRKAFGVSLTLDLNDTVSPAQGSGSTQVGDLAPGQAVTLTLGLVLDAPSALGRVTQTFRLAYRDGDDVEHTSEETASLDLGSASRQDPQLIVSAHRTLPEHPGPGDTFTLSLTLTNVGAGPARRVLTRLGGQAGPDPFLPLGASNVAYAAEIAPGASATLSQTLLMDGEAEGGAYPLSVELSYENRLGEEQTETESIGLLTLARPQVQFDLTKPLPEPASVGQTFDIAVEIINVGRQRLEVSTVEVQSEALALTRSRLYVGPLDASISGGLTAKATAETAGPATFRVIVHYRDELNQMQTLEQTYTIEVQPANSLLSPEAAPQTANAVAGLWQWVMRFLGLGG
jgi:hypothetical protein